MSHIQHRNLKAFKWFAGHVVCNVAPSPTYTIKATHAAKRTHSFEITHFWVVFRGITSKPNLLRNEFGRFSNHSFLSEFHPRLGDFYSNFEWRSLRLKLTSRKRFLFTRFWVNFTHFWVNFTYSCVNFSRVWVIFTQIASKDHSNSSKHQEHVLFQHISGWILFIPAWVSLAFGWFLLKLWMKITQTPVNIKKTFSFHTFLGEFYTFLREFLPCLSDFYTKFELFMCEFSPAFSHILWWFLLIPAWISPTFRDFYPNFECRSLE